MSTVLFYLSPQTGHTFPLVPTWQELKRRGHRVVVRCSPELVELLLGLDIDASAVDPRIVAREQDDWLATSPTDALGRSMRTFLDRAVFEIEDLRRAIDEEDPDILVIDGLCWGAGAAAERSGLPWAWDATWPLALDSRDTPPPGLGLSPLRGPVGAIRDRAVATVTNGFYRPHLAALNALRRGLGVSEVRSFSEMWTDRALATILYLSDALEYPRSDLPQSVTLVGAGIWSPAAPPPPWFDKRTGSIILVSCSTERQADEVLARTAIQALADSATLVVTTGASRASLPAVGPNVHIERFLPHALLMPTAACVVSTGGMGLVHTALAAGVPVCAVPFGRDQPEVARRLVVAGVGAMVPAARLSPERLRAGVADARALGENARSIAPRLGADTSATRAADILESLAR